MNSGSNKPEYSILGLWTFTDPDLSGQSIEFFDNLSLYAISPEEILSGGYYINYNSNPIELNLEMEQMEEVKTIIQFLDENTIKIQNNNVGLAMPVWFTEDSKIMPANLILIF